MSNKYRERAHNFTELFRDPELSLWVWANIFGMNLQTKGASGRRKYKPPHCFNSDEAKFLD